MLVDINEAQNKLATIIDSALDGDEVIITKSGQAVAQLLPVQVSKSENPHKRKFGMLKGKIEISEEFESQQVQDSLATEFGL